MAVEIIRREAIRSKDINVGLLSTGMRQGLPRWLDRSRLTILKPDEFVADLTLVLGFLLISKVCLFAGKICLENAPGRRGKKSVSCRDR